MNKLRMAHFVLFSDLTVHISLNQTCQSGFRHGSPLLRSVNLFLLPILKRSHHKSRNDPSQRCDDLGWQSHGSHGGCRHGHRHHHLGQNSLSSGQRHLAHHAEDGVHGGFGLGFVRGGGIAQGVQDQGKRVGGIGAVCG